MKEITVLMDEANSQLNKYKEIAIHLGRLVCSKLKEEKGWECEFRLGDYEAGPETITIEVSSGVCCWSELMDEEMKWMDLVAERSFCFSFKPPRTADFMNKRCKKHKNE